MGIDSRTKGWYTASVHVDKASKLEEILDWISDNIDGSDKHTYYTWSDPVHLEVRFRHKKSFEWFVLRWL